MPKFIVDLWLDGYETEEEMAKWETLKALGGKGWDYELGTLEG